MEPRVPLPVLPLGRESLDNTALSAFMACPREYYLAMVLHRRAEGGKSPSLAFGGVMHKLLEYHYKTGGAASLAEIVAAKWWEANGHSEEGDHRTLARALLDYKRYREKWGQKPEDEVGETVGWPDQPAIELHFNIRAGRLEIPWAGRLDRIIELGGLFYAEDHKTSSRLDKNFYSSFELSNQMMGYTWAAQHLMPSLKIVGVRLNVIHVLKDKTNFERQLITYTKEQIAEWESNTVKWQRRIRDDVAGWPSEEVLLAGEGEWPLAHLGDNGCSRKFGPCQFTKVCRVAVPFRHRVLAEIPVNVWDPMNLDD